MKYYKIEENEILDSYVQKLRSQLQNKDLSIMSNNEQRIIIKKLYEVLEIPYGIINSGIEISGKYNILWSKYKDNRVHYYLTEQTGFKIISYEELIDDFLKFKQK